MSNKMQILALDVGTSSIKSAILDVSTGEPVGSIHRADYDLSYPTPDAAEIDPDHLWSAVTKAARQAMGGVESIDGIGFSTLMPGLILLDKDDKPLYPIWTHLDRRSRESARQVWAAVGEEFLTTTGNRPLPGGISAVCFRQLVREDPHLVRAVKHYFHINSWLVHRLTGKSAFDRANASFTGLYDTITAQEWSPRWCEYFEVEPSWLPPVVCGTTTVGTVRSHVAAELSVPPGVPVKLGTADTSSAMLALDMKEGDLLHTVGTTQVLATITSHPQPDPERLVRQLGVGDAFLHVTHNPVGGVALEWIHDLCFQDQSPEQFFEETVFSAMDRETRVSLDPPFLGGDRLQIEACRASFRDLTLSTDRLDLLAALLQEMRRQHATAVKRLGVSNFSRIFLTGGGAELIQKLIPEYEDVKIHSLDEAALRGISRLFG